MASPRLGLLIHGSTPPAEIANCAMLAENTGFNDFWLSEDYFLLGGFTSAAIALQATRKISIGIGAISTVARHPAVTAMETATLAGAFPGRLQLAFGHGVPAWTRQMGLYPKSILTSMREAITGVRALLNGETYSAEGHFKFRNISLQHPVENVPILTGVLGPKSVALSAEIADGNVLSAFSGPRYVTQTKEIAAEAMQACGRTSPYELPTYVIYAVNKDRAAAKGLVRMLVSHYLVEMGPSAITAAYGVNDDLQAMIDQGGAEAVMKKMPDEWLDWLTVSGTPEECAERIKALHNAGATSIVLSPVPPDTMADQVKLTAEEVIPRL